MMPDSYKLDSAGDQLEAWITVMMPRGVSEPGATLGCVGDCSASDKEIGHCHSVIKP